MNDMQLAAWYTARNKGHVSSRERNRAIDSQFAGCYGVNVADMREVRTHFVYAVLEPFGA